jgi:hypothetical protein
MSWRGICATRMVYCGAGAGIEPWIAASSPIAIDTIGPRQFALTSAGCAFARGAGSGDHLSGPHGDRPRHARLPRRPAESLHGQLGPRLHRGHADRQGPALPRGGNHSGRSFPRPTDGPPQRKLGGQSHLRPLPRQGLDVGASSRLHLQQQDWGGCRCQALARARDASATDLVCGRSSLSRSVATLIAAHPASAFVCTTRPQTIASRVKSFE